MAKIEKFPKPERRDLIQEMTGPERNGCSVIVDGHVIPNMVMFDRGDTIELMLDDRLVFPFPRELAYQAADFAACAMAIGAGWPHYKYPRGDRPYATPCGPLPSMP